MTVAEYTINDFKADFPEFADSSFDASINAALAAAPPKFDETQWGDELRDGLGYWVAFRVSLKKQIQVQGAGFASASSNSVEKTVGQVSIKTTQSQSQATQHGTSAIYNANAYGKVYADMARLVGAGMVAI